MNQSFNLPGGPLTPSDLAALAARAIDKATADAAMLRHVESAAGAELVGRKESGRYEGMIIPYFTLDGERFRDVRLRRDHPEVDSRGKPIGKYMGPPGRRSMLYVVPWLRPEWLLDSSVPIVIVEGEFKAISLSALVRTDGTPAFIVLAFPGVWNFRGVIGKTQSADGERVDEKGPIADLDRVTWQNRVVTIFFDVDTETNDSVAAARRECTRELQGRGAIMKWVKWPKGLPAHVTGVDDLIAHAGGESVLSLIQSAKQQRPLKQAAHVEFSADWEIDQIRDQRMQPRGILANAITVLRKHPSWEGVLGRSDFSGYTYARKETPWGFRGRWNGDQDRLATEHLQRLGVVVNVDVAADAIETAAAAQPFHEVRDEFNSLQWDGEPRLSTWLINYLGAEDCLYSREVGRKWLIALIARAFRSGCKVDVALILEGRQGIGKSKALKVIGGKYFTDELSDLLSKDSAMQLQGALLIELSELDSIARAEVSKIKAFISRTTDRFRPPYGRRVIEWPRQCVFAGSVNNSSYLKDETGGRRFWPVRCGDSIDLEGLARDRDQLLAEAINAFHSGENWWLESSDMVAAAEVEQSARFDADPWQEKIETWIESRSMVSVPQILETCLDIPTGAWKQPDANRVARTLVALGWEKFQHRDGESRIWRYRRAK